MLGCSRGGIVLKDLVGYISRYTRIDYVTLEVHRYRYYA